MNLFLDQGILMPKIEAYISKDDFRDILMTVKIPAILVQE